MRLVSYTSHSSDIDEQDYITSVTYHIIVFYWYTTEVLKDNDSLEKHVLKHANHNSIVGIWQTSGVISGFSSTDAVFVIDDHFAADKYRRLINMVCLFSFMTY